MTGSASTTEKRVPANQVADEVAAEKAAGREEAIRWLASQLYWERRLRQFVEAKAMAAVEAAVAAPATMSHDRDDLDAGGGVADGLEAVGSLV